MCCLAIVQRFMAVRHKMLYLRLLSGWTQLKTSSPKNNWKSFIYLPMLFELFIIFYFPFILKKVGDNFHFLDELSKFSLHNFCRFVINHKQPSWGFQQKHFFTLKKKKEKKKWTKPFKISICHWLNKRSHVRILDGQNCIDRFTEVSIWGCFGGAESIFLKSDFSKDWTNLETYWNIENRAVTGYD